MSDNTKRILKWSSIGAVIIAIVVVLWLYLPAIKGNITNEKYYTQQEMDKAVEDAYNKGVGDKQALDEQIKTLKIELSIAQENYQNVAKELAIAQSQNADNEEEIAQLKEIISNNEQKILELQNQVAYLENLLEEYGETSLIPVTFYVNEEVYDVQLVEIQSYLDESEVTDPILTGYKFDYWTLDKQTEIDFTTLQITEELNIYAKFTALDNDITLKFAVNGSLHQAEVAGQFVFSSCTDAYIDKPLQSYNPTYSYVDSGSILIVDVYLYNSFTFAPVSNVLHVSNFSSDATCAVQTTVIETCDFESTGYTYHTQLTITDVNCSGEVTILVEPIYYTVEILDSVNNLSYTIDNVVYGRELNLKSVLSEAKQNSLTSATTPAGTNFAGLYTMPNCQGTQYYDSELNALSNWFENGYTFNGGKYVPNEGFNVAERKITLYSGFAK